MQRSLREFVCTAQAAFVGPGATPAISKQLVEEMKSDSAVSAMLAEFTAAFPEVDLPHIPLPGGGVGNVH